MLFTNPSSIRLLCDPVTEDPNYQPAPEDRPGGFQWGQVCKKMLNLGRSQVFYLALYLALPSASRPTNINMKLDSLLRPVMSMQKEKRMKRIELLWTGH